MLLVRDFFIALCTTTYLFLLWAKLVLYQFLQISFTINSCLQEINTYG